MKRAFCFLFVFFFDLLFVQVSFGLAEEPSFYEEFNPQEELTQEEKGALPNSPNALAGSSAKNSSGTQSDFFLTDEKHAHFLQENEQYALADSMLNQTWKLLIKKLNKKEYRKLWQEHKVWLDTNRNTVANSFKKQVPAIPEDHAFMLATVAKTQELAQSVWHEPVLGHYVKGENFVTLIKEDDKIFLQGYGNVPYLAKNNDAAKEEKTDAAAEDTAKLQAENPQEKSITETENTVQADTKKEDTAAKQAEKNTIKTMPQLFFRAELPQGKLWLALETVNGQKLYLLTTQNSLCIVHAPNAFPLDFNGVFMKNKVCVLKNKGIFS